MSDSNPPEEWNPTFRTPDGEELERSDWGKWRNGPQTKDAHPNKWVQIDIRAGTRERLREAKREGESYDQVCNRLVEQSNTGEMDE